MHKVTAFVLTRLCEPKQAAGVCPMKAMNLRDNLCFTIMFWRSVNLELFSFNGFDFAKITFLKSTAFSPVKEGISP
ncbi:MAG: hypothetical protein JXA46_01790 [Dehalococcoidales bacterium]|nr:hypothetical protein [Dehalococcoidales bacterium]